LYHLGTVNGTEYLFKIDAASGVLEGQLPITADGYSFHFMTMANGVIYTTNGNTFNPLLTAFDAQTGNLLWSSTESGASDLPAIIAGGKVYVVRLNASEVVVYGP
jgi:outer membrane protein assembly factor BamB